MGALLHPAGRQWALERSDAGLGAPGEGYLLLGGSQGEVGDEAVLRYLGQMASGTTLVGSVWMQHSCAPFWPGSALSGDAW